MSSQTTSAEGGRHARKRTIMSVVDRVALGLMYALVIAVLPVTAVGFITRTV